MLRYRYLRCFPRGRRVQTTGQKLHNVKRNVNILEFGDKIQNDHEKYIQKVQTYLAFFFIVW